MRIQCRSIETRIRLRRRGCRLFLYDRLILKGEEQAVQEWGEGGDDERCCNDSTQEPDDEGVPLPCPKKLGNAPRMVADCEDEGCAVQWKAACVEDYGTYPDKDEEEDELQWIDDVVSDLGCEKIESKHEGDGQGNDRRRAKKGIDADGESDGKRPGELARARADAKKIK